MWWHWGHFWPGIFRSCENFKCGCLQIDYNIFTIATTDTVAGVEAGAFFLALSSIVYASLILARLMIIGRLSTVCKVIQCANQMLSCVQSVSCSVINTLSLCAGL